MITETIKRIREIKTDITALVKEQNTLCRVLLKELEEEVEGHLMFREVESLPETAGLPKLPAPVPHFPEEKRHRAKITPAVKKRIKKYRGLGWTQIKIARKVGCSLSTVIAVLKG